MKKRLLFLLLLCVLCIPIYRDTLQAQWFSIPQRPQTPVTIDTNAVRGYRVYSILITQTDENAPVVTVLQNTFGVIPLWEYRGEGFYSCNFSGGFLGDTCVFVQDNHVLYDNINLEIYWIYIEKLSSGFSLYTYAPDGGGGNGRLTNIFLEFRIY